MSAVKLSFLKKDAYRWSTVMRLAFPGRGPLLEGNELDIRCREPSQDRSGLGMCGRWL
jgi:hypothetical protein